MKRLLPQYYRISNEELSCLVKEGIFVFDTSVLLNLYRYPLETREKFLHILETLSEQERLWIPFQVAIEFQENRLSVIADQKDQYSKVKKILDDIQRDLKTKLDDLHLHKRHSTINPDALINDISSAFQRYRDEYNSLALWTLDIDDEDELRDKIGAIFTDKIGKPFSQAELDAIYKDGNERYKSKRPPGYKDGSEKKDYFIFHEDLSIKQEFGDLIIWQELKNFANQIHPKGIIFITDDRKEDWWQKVGGRTVGPRPELISEFQNQTGLPYYMYGSDQFLTILTEYAGIEVEPAILSSVSDILGNVEISTVVSDLIGEIAADLVNSDEELISGMSATNATGYMLDDFEIIDLDPNEKRGIIDFSADLIISGEQDEDSPYCGNSFTVGIEGRAKCDQMGDWHLQSFKTTYIKSNWPD